MSRFIAFLRAVNVGGRVVKMERLRAIFFELGLSNVRTYIQSGNVFFDTRKTDRSGLARTIERGLAAALGFEVTTFLRTVDEVERAVALDPFRGAPSGPDTRHAVVFLSQPLPSELRLPLRSPKGEAEILAATPGEAFVLLHLKGGRPTNDWGFAEKVSSQPTTMRFFHTTIKILEAARQG